MQATTETAGPRAGRREWLGLAVLALPTLLLALDLSVLYLALPRLSVELGADTVQQLWITDIFGFMLAGFLITMGRLGDRIGRRRLLMIGAATFAAASVAAAFSTSPEMLIAMRAVMGIAAACLAPSTLALISTMFQSPKQQALAIAIWMSCFMGGIAIGPLIGGVLLQFFWWGSVFLLGVPVMILLLVAAPLVLPEFSNPQRLPLDFVGVSMSLLAILPTIYGIKELANNGWQLVPALSIVVGLVFGYLFVNRQRTIANPVLDLKLFRNRTFSTAMTMMLVGGIFLGGTTLLVTQYLQLVQGLSPLAAGLWLVPAIVAMIIGTIVAPILARRVRPAYVMAAGLGIAALGYLVLTQVDSTGSLPLLVIGWTVALGGNGLPAGLAVGLIIGSAPPEEAGSASAAQQTGQEFGLALGIAVLGSLASGIYRREIADSLSGVPAAAADAARESVNGALTTAQQLPELAAAARAAYTTGLNVAVGLSAVVFAALAVLISVQLRDVPPVGAATGGPPAPAEDDNADGSAEDGDAPESRPTSAEYQPAP
jgi:DHA2 family multidrug resistance protein-like MFS transporter